MPGIGAKAMDRPGSQAIENLFAIDEVGEVLVEIDEGKHQSMTFLDVEIPVKIDEVKELIENLFARSQGSDEHKDEIAMEAAKFEITINLARQTNPAPIKMDESGADPNSNIFASEISMTTIKVAQPTHP